MSIKLFNNSKHTTIATISIWLIASIGIILWLVFQMRSRPADPNIDSQIHLIEVPKLLKAAELVSKDELTTNAPTATLNSEPASPAATIEQPELEKGGE